MSTPLELRRHNLELAASRTADILVVGGGINGVGIALDASARGLKTVLVERDDFGVGTSSRSSKLIHGGLRYLEHYAFGLVREALGERHLLATRLAPHLVEIHRFLLPSYGSRLGVPYVAAGLSLYDLLGGSRDGAFRLLTKAKANEMVPELREQTRRGRPDGNRKMRAAFVYSDGVVDDARYVTALARTASEQGAVLLTKVELISFHESGPIDSNGRIDGATVRDRLGGEPLVIKARMVVDATGAFDVASSGPKIRASRGVHLVIPRSLVRSEVGLTIRVADRVIFLIPWGDFWIVGTTDVPHAGSIDRPTATLEEVEYLIDALDDVLESNITIDDVVATYAGIRPLIGNGDDTVSISREDGIDEISPGCITVRGGKFTTYRKVAERTVDLCLRSGLGPFTPSTTKDLPLVGAIDAHAQATLVAQLVQQGLEARVANHLVGRYGSEAGLVANAATELSLTDPLAAGLNYLAIEAWWAIHYEQALDIDDVLSRRTRISITDPNHGRGAAVKVAAMLGDALGWGTGERLAAVEHYCAGVEREFGVPQSYSTTRAAAPEGVSR